MRSALYFFLFFSVCFTFGCFFGFALLFYFILFFFLSFLEVLDWSTCTAPINRFASLPSPPAQSHSSVSLCKFLSKTTFSRLAFSDFSPGFLFTSDQSVAHAKALGKCAQVLPLTPYPLYHVFPLIFEWVCVRLRRRGEAATIPRTLDKKNNNNVASFWGHQIGFSHDISLVFNFAPQFFILFLYPPSFLSFFGLAGVKHSCSI